MAKRSPAKRYIVLCGQVVGGADRPFEVVYYFDGEVFDERCDAIRHGLKVRGSDDFNIGVIEGRKLVSLDWMNDAVDTDPSVLTPIQAQIFLPA